MTIGIVGLGLIGGSLAKAIRKRTGHTVLGGDVQDAIVLRAQAFEAIHGELTDANLAECDIVFLALYPKDALEYAAAHAALFRKGGILVDCCGVKSAVCPELFALAREHGFAFVGGHPMAGIEYSGFLHAQSHLFENASMILVPDENTEIAALHTLKQLFLSLGFSKVPVVSMEEHDRVIAYTSQLAHVVSSAYVKCPHAKKDALSAGSFQDMTRVAQLNADMWTQLFLMNRTPLLEELDGLVARLQGYADALRSNNAGALWDLLEEGNRIKVALT
ncbi:MAG: prephenate dehydrogenase/arogenate dehydrogenase family protein [Oscillospiraceae bacterium]|jgi:prephenate dehydrogenase|nr:prephenate dehydrogenase/arogenate dehydrogenase family protein [Oscillospiraceae bacterium]